MAQSSIQVAAIVRVVAVIVAAPLLGLWLAGQPIEPFLRFPPRPIAPAPSSFTPLYFIVYAALIVATLGPFVVRVLRTRRASAKSTKPARIDTQSYPRWGWWGVALLALSWIVAWVPISGLEEARRLSFTPLWVGYTVAISAWVVKRGGRSLMIEQPGRFLALFPVSALFWYLFEYLNQFTGNWIYAGTGVTEREALNWFLRSALPFSTVLPAVLTTRDWFATYPRVYAGLSAFAPLHASSPRRASIGAWLAGAAGLVAVAIWPNGLYAMLCAAPPLVIVAAQQFAGQRHLFTDVARGDWRAPWLAVLAALFCGFCWELWNVFSLARWTYHIPHAQVLHLFEMPLLGYAGYLPFGITCVVAAHLLVGIDPRARYQ